MKKCCGLDKNFIQLLVILHFGLAIAACHQRKEPPLDTPRTDTLLPPITVVAGKPFLVDLDTCPKPQRIKIPEKDSQYFVLKTTYWERTLKLVPPTSNLADYYMTMKKLGNEEGLQAHSVVASLRDRLGNLWFGTSGGGVARYDGKSVVTFTGLLCNEISSIVEDKQNNMWFGMINCGLAKYDGKKLVSYSTKQGLVNNNVICLAIDKSGNLWIGTGLGACRFDGKKFTTFTTDSGLPDNKITGITEDHKGNIWFATELGASCYDGKSFKNFTMAQGLKSNYVSSVFCDSKGDVWFGMGRGIARYSKDSVINYPDSLFVSRYSVSCIREASNNDIWFGTSGGVTRYNGQLFENFTVKQGLAANNVTTIAEDNAGNIWLGAVGGGVTCYTGGAVKKFSTEQGMFYNHISAIKEDRKGNLWLGASTGGFGVTRFDGRRFTNYAYAQGFIPGNIEAIVEDKKQNLWFCTGAGITFFDGETFTNYSRSHGLRSNHVTGAVEDTAGNLWFGLYNGGLSMFNGKTMANYSPEQGLPGDNISTLVIDKSNNIWISIYGKGLTRFDGKTFMNFDTSQGLGDNFIKSLELDSRGNLWIGGASRGVSIFRKESMDKIQTTRSSFPQKFFDRFSTTEGLANNVVYDIAEDKEGNIFIGTNFGYTVIKGGLLPGRAVQRSDIEYYNQKTGYPINDMNTRAMLVDSKGILWGGTGYDLVSFNYTAVRKSKLPLLVTLQGIKIDNENPGWYYLQAKQQGSKVITTEMMSSIGIEENLNSDLPLSGATRDSFYHQFKKLKFDSISRFYPVPVNLVLPYQHNRITFEFAAIEPAKPDFVLYQYILVGYDKDWGPATNQSSASFGNISEGRYTFKVKALSPDGVWSEPVEYTFRVLAPWYRTWWAYSAYLIFLGLLLYAIYQNSIRKLQHKQTQQLKTVISTQEEERKRISRDLHDDVGTKLSALKLFLAALKRNSQQQQYGEVIQLAENSEQLINETIKDVREMLLNLSPGILEEFGYANAIEVLINKINLTNSIHFDLSIFGIKSKLKKDYELALYRITQELINNVLKHSEATQVTLQLGYRDEKIIIMIEDDGKGFDLAQHKDGYGLKNLEARTRLLNGNISIDSGQGKGTSVLIEVPYKFN